MRKSRQNKYTGLFYVLPFVIGLLVFQLYPFLASFFYSFTDLSIANDWSWVGLSNYIKSFTADRDFWNSLKVTGIYVFIAVPCKLVFALFIAMVLNMKIRGIRFFQTLYYIPSILGGSVAVSVIWRFMFSHDGLVNTLTSYLGLPALAGQQSPGASHRQPAGRMAVRFLDGSVPRGSQADPRFPL